MTFSTLNETSVFLLGSVRSVLPVAAIPAFEHMGNINNDISSRKNYAIFFHLLSYDSCIDAVIPLKMAPILQQCLELEKLELPPSVTKVVEMADQMRFYNQEVSDLLHLKNSRNLLPEEALRLLQYCFESVLKIHKSDVCEDEMVIESEMYNPTKFVRGYYFTEHGCQILKFREFSIDQDREKTVNFDDTRNLCSKNFSKSVKEAYRIFSCGFAPSMAIAGVSTLFQEQKVGKSQQPLCTRIMKKHQM